MEGTCLGYRVFSNGTIYKKMIDAPLKAYPLPTGYMIVGLRVNGRSRSRSVHRMVAEALLPNPNKLSDVDHINGNRADNRLENLRWVSHGENIRLSYESGRRSAKGEMNARCKTNEETVHKICKLLALGHKPSKIRDMGYPYIQVRSIKQGKNWGYISKEYGL